MSKEIKITFLGTAASIPSANKNPTAVLLNYSDENILIDCGEGTQRQIRKAGLNPCRLTRILITHWHGDHVLGIPGLLQTLALSGYNKKLFIYGPRGTKNFMREMFKTFVFVNKLDLEIEEVSGKFFENEDFYLEAESMTHGIPTNAYNFATKGKIRIDKKKLMKTKLPAGPILKKLKEGKDVVYEEKRFSAKNLTFSEGGKKISFVWDTGMNEKIVPFAKDADVLIIESSYSDDLKEQAKEYKHMTVKQVSEIAKKSKAKKLILTHISQRYDCDKKKILDEAKKIFKNSELAKDLMSLRI